MNSAHKPRIYISGPISGVEDFRSPFVELSQILEEYSCIPLNPCVLPEGLTQKEYMQICISMLNISNMAVFLPGWECSEGAKLEHAYCKKCGLPITYLESDEDLDSMRKTLEILYDVMEVLQ